MRLDSLNNFSPSKMSLNPFKEEANANKINRRHLALALLISLAALSTIESLLKTKESIAQR